MENQWILTDDDSQQYVRHIKEEEFQLIEMSLINPETEEYEVYTDTIDVDYFCEIERGAVNTILNGFGYENVEDVISKYKDASQVIAECIFEYYGSYFAERIFIGSKGACEKFIKDWINLSNI